MRQQALLLCAAVTLCLSAAGQHAYVPQHLSFAKSCDIANINKPAIHHMNNEQAKDKSILPGSHFRLAPQLNLADLHQQLGNDIQHLKVEKRNEQWRGTFQGVMQGARSNNQAGNKL
jgi:hypothetical protein